jgi:hypothetical protein
MKAFYLIALPVIALITTACEKPERTARFYREVSMIPDNAIAPGTPPMMMPVATNAPTTPAGAASAMGELPPELRTQSLPLEWTTPEGWTELAGSGMRIATWNVEGQECTLMSFPGDVGGDEANIRRWLGQVGQSVPAEALAAFVASPARFTTAGGFEGRLFDFADLPGATGQSVLASIIPIGDQSAFVKLMGDAAVLKRQKAAFETLSRSITLKPEAR